MKSLGRHAGLRVRASTLFTALLLLVPAAVGSWVVPPAIAEQAKEATVADLVAKLPADSVGAGQSILAEILKRGADAVAEVVAMVVPPGSGDDAKARFALYGMAHHVTRPDARAERALFVRILLEKVEGAADVQVKSFLIGLLQVAGGDESVKPLSKFLTDPVLCEPATQALLSIRTQSVGAAILGALPKAEGACRVTLVRALGDLRVREAAKALLPYAEHADPTLRATALWALAEIGDPAAATVLLRAAEESPCFVRAQANAHLLTFVRRLAQQGKKKEALRICRNLLLQRTASNDRHLYVGALATLVDVHGNEALPDLVAALRNPDKQVRMAALRLAARLPGEQVSRRLAAEMESVAPEVRAEIVAVLGQRQDRLAAGAVLAALKDQDKAVRFAAVEAAARLGSKEALESLLALVSGEDPQEIAIVKAALLRFPNAALLGPAAAALSRASAPGRVALLQILSARRAEAQLPAMLAAIKDQSPPVRVAVLQAIGQLAGPEALPQILAFLMAAPEGPEQEAAQQAVVAVCERIPDATARSERLLAALQSAAGAARERLFGVLAAVGGEKAAQAVAAETESADAGLQDAAVRALADWRDASAAPHLLRLAKEAKNARHRVVATRGYIRVAGLLGNSAVEQQVAMLREALRVAERPDEKRLALAALSEIRHLEALKAAATLLDDPVLAEDAAAAVVRIALGEKGKEEREPLQGPEVTATLAKVVAVTQDAELKAQANAYLRSASVSDTANLALGKPVKTTVPHEGDHIPAKAVDGNASDRDSAWFGSQTPCSLTVDLQHPATIDCVHVFFYWDGTRYYQYTVETSLDEKEWKTVVDASKNERPATSRGVVHCFDPVEARYVRVTVLKNSANQAAHLVELRVYAAGASRELSAAGTPDAEGFVALFNGKDLTGWTGSVNGYVVQDGVLVCLKESGGLLRTEEQYADFAFRFEFRLEPGANNGVGIRFTGGNPAYDGMEIQILDDTAEIYKNLQPWQYHGSIYGVVPAKRGHLKPVGEWNSEEIIAKGRRVVVILNGVTIVDADLDRVMAEGGPADKKPHPGLLNAKGFIGFMGHGARVEFRNIRLKEL